MEASILRSQVYCRSGLVAVGGLSPFTYSGIPGYSFSPGFVINSFYVHGFAATLSTLAGDLERLQNYAATAIFPLSNVLLNL